MATTEPLKIGTSLRAAVALGSGEDDRDPLRPPDLCTYALTGRVVGSDHKPVAGATLRSLFRPLPANGLVAEDFANVTTETDPSGTFRLAGARTHTRYKVKLSDSRLTVTAEGYEPLTIKVPHLKAYGEVDLGDVVLERMRTVDVTVVDKHGAAVAAAQVFVRRPLEQYNAGGGTLLDTRKPNRVTDDRGQCRVYLPHEASIVYALGSKLGVASHRCPPGLDACTITLPDAVVVPIICTIAEDHPVGDAKVDAVLSFHASARDGGKYYTDPDGRVDIPWAGDNESDLYARWTTPDGILYYGSQTVEPRDSLTEPIEIRLKRRTCSVDLTWTTGGRQIREADSAMLITSWLRGEEFLEDAIADVRDEQVGVQLRQPNRAVIRAYNPALGFGKTELILMQEWGCDSKAHLVWSDDSSCKPLLLRVLAADGKPVSDADVRFVFYLPDSIWPNLPHDSIFGPGQSPPFRVVLERRTNEDGVVTLPAAPRADGTCTVLAPGHPTASATLHPNTGPEMVVQLDAPAELVFRAPGLQETELPDAGGNVRLIIENHAGVVLVNEQLSESGDVALEDGPSGPVEMRLEVDPLQLRDAAGVFEAGFLDLSNIPGPSTLWSRRVELRAGQRNDVVAQTLQMEPLSDIDIIADPKAPRGFVTLTRVAIRGFANGKPRRLSVPLGNRKVRIGGIPQGTWVLEALDSNGTPWWWRTVKIEDDAPTIDLALHAPKHYELQMANLNLPAGCNIHRNTEDGHPMRWSKIPLNGLVRLVPGEYSILSIDGTLERRFTLGPHGTLEVAR